MDFSKEKCVVCGKNFSNDDEVVVCPECGSPHHRVCYAQLGKCYNSERHGTDYVYKSASCSEDTADACICSKCGKEISDDSKFCPYCGNSTDEKGFNNKKFGTFINIENESDFEEFKENLLKNMQGDPNAEIEGVKETEICKFISFSPMNIIAKFRKFIRTKSKINFNIFAFISPVVQSFFRKMDSLAFVYFAFEVIAYVLMTPVLSIIYNSGGVTDSSALIKLLIEKLQGMNAMYYTMFLVGIALFFGIRIVSGLFNDYYYKNHVINAIKNYAAGSKLSKDEYYKKKGGIRPFLSLVLFMILQYLGSIVSTLLSYISNLI